MNKEGEKEGREEGRKEGELVKVKIIGYRIKNTVEAVQVGHVHLP